MNKDRNNAHLALVEDDDSIREMVEINLKSEGFTVDSFFSIEQLERRGQLANYDLLILDVNLPGANGLAFAQKLKDEGHIIPILFISAYSQEQKIEKAYKAGAIDYMVKPFEISILIQKIKNLTFYFVPRTSMPLPNRVGSAMVNWDLMTVERGGESVSLTPKEAQALMYFVNNPDRIIKRKELLMEIWGSDAEISGRNIDNFMVKFRRLFEEEPTNPIHFITFPKKGYAFKTNPNKEIE